MVATDGVQSSGIESCLRQQVSVLLGQPEKNDIYFEFIFKRDLSRVALLKIALIFPSTILFEFSSLLLETSFPELKVIHKIKSHFLTLINLPINKLIFALMPFRHSENI